MKTILITITFALIAFLGIATPAVAGAAGNPFIPVCNGSNNTGTDASNSAVCKDVNSQSNDKNPIIKIIKAAVSIVSYITGAAAVILIIISSIRFVTSGGDANNVAQAKNALLYALVGVAITVAARAIISFVLNKV